MFRRVWHQTHLVASFYKIVVAVAMVCLCSCMDSDVNRGNEALRIGDYDRAIANFSKALDAEPANRDARYGLALSYYAVAERKEHLKVPTLSLWERAVSEFQILARVDSSGRIDANYSTSLFYLARATIAENGSANVLPMLDKSIELDSLNFFSYNLKALILANGGNVEEAKSIYVYVLTKEPKFVSAYMNLGNLYWDAGDVESAWDIWSMGLQKNPDDKSLAYWTSVAEDSLRFLVESGKL